MHLLNITYFILSHLFILYLIKNLQFNENINNLLLID